MLFGTSNNPMCHIFLILSYVYILFSESYLSLTLFLFYGSSITVSPAMPSTTSNTSSQMPSVNGWYSNNQTKQHLPWSVNISTLLPPCCLPAASHFPHYWLNTRRSPPNAGVGHCRLTSGQSSGFNQCTAHCLNKIKKGKHSLLQLVEYNSCRAKATTLRNDQQHGDGNGQQQWQLQWPTVTETAMADGKGNGKSNGWRQHDRDGSGNGWWQPQWQWLTAVVTGMGNCNGDGDGNGNNNGRLRQQWQWRRSR